MIGDFYIIMILTSTDYYNRACGNDDSELKKNSIHKFVYFHTSNRLIDPNGLQLTD